MRRIKTLKSLKDQEPQALRPGDLYLTFTGTTIFIRKAAIGGKPDLWLATVSTFEGRRGLHFQRAAKGNWLETKDFSRRACELGHARSLLVKYLPYFTEAHIRVMVEINQTGGYAECRSEDIPDPGNQ